MADWNWLLTFFPAPLPVSFAQAARIKVGGANGAVFRADADSIRNQHYISPIIGFCRPFCWNP